MSAGNANLLEPALQYHRLGWSIVPVHYNRGKKRPAVRWKRYQRKPGTEATLGRWFKDAKYPAFAVVLGEVSGHLACRDFDDPKVYERWAEEFPELARILPTAKTGKGYHVYFIAVVKKTRHFPDGELRGEKSTCCLPPSLHPNGNTYRWVIPPADDNLLGVYPERAGFIPEELLQKQAEAIRAIRCNLIAGKEKDEIELAIEATLPLGPGMRNQKVFQLARALKGISSLANKDAQEMHPIVREWHGRALSVIQTKEFDETWIDFLLAWPRVHTPMSMNLMENAMVTARNNPIQDLPYGSEGVRDLLALCRELQGIMGEKPFWLSTRTAGRVLRVCAMKAWRWLFLLEHDGWIETVTKGDKHRATRFRYTGNGQAP